jgi:hypothetical protein
MDKDKYITHARFSFAMLRWGTIVALVVLPFTFSKGTASLAVTASALPIALGWLTSLMMAWRTRNQLWFVLSFLIVVVAPRFLGLRDTELPKPHTFQWLCYVLILMGAPLLIFRSRMLELARLNQMTNKAAHPTAGNALL